MKLKAVYMSVGFLSGLFFAFYMTSGGVAAILAAIAAILLLALFLRSELRGKIFLLCAFILLGICYSYAHTSLVVQPLEALDGQTTAFYGEVISASDEDSGQVIIDGRVNGHRCKTVLYLSNFSGDIGDKVSFEGKVSALGSDGLFDAKSYYYPDGIYLQASVSDNLKVTVPESYSITAKLRRYPAYCTDRIREYAKNDIGGLICAMTTGDTSYLSDSARLSLNRSGIGHITAVSGLHVGITCTFVTFLLRKLRLSKRTSALVSIIPITVFVVFSGLKVSAIRAAVMMCIYLFSYTVNRKAHPLNTLSLCALIMALFNPYIIADASFILSLSGVFSVSVFAPYVCKISGIKNKAGMSLITAVCAWIGSLPALALYFNELSLVSVIANLLLVPLGSSVLILTLIFVLFGCPPALSLLIKTAAIAGKIILSSCEWLSSFEFTYIPLLGNELRVLLAVLAFISIALFFISRKCGIYSVILGICIFFGGYLYKAESLKDKLILETVYDKGNCALLLHKNSECIIIDISNGVKLLDTCEDILLEAGIKSIPIATANKNGESAYTKLTSFAIEPKCLYLPSGTYIYNPDTEYIELHELTVIDFGGARADILSDGVYIDYDGKSIAVSAGIARGSDMSISVFGGATVINGNEVDGSGKIRIDLSKQ